MNRNRLFFLIAALSFAVSCSAADKPWAGWGFLIGEWVGEGTGNPGQGTGGFTFESDLQGKILVRKSRAEYPATEKTPAYRHDDLMVVFADPVGHYHADYYDSEGHVIRYSVELTPNHDGAIFTSDPSSPGPQFRLTYATKADGVVTIKFEIAPPGKAFATYLEASARRK